MAATLTYISPSGLFDSAEDSHTLQPGRLRDKFGRAITDLRVSVTDRCNYRCVYCRTGNEGAQFTELPIADYLRMVRIFVSLGVEKVRLTGGEPLLRSGLVEMVEELARMRTAYLPDGTPVSTSPAKETSAAKPYFALESKSFWQDRTSYVPPTNASLPLDIALTTNGHLLEGLAEPLKRAGLNRVTVSMDAVDAETFTAITRVPRSFDKVMAGIRKAQSVGLGPVKVNCVLLRGFNDGQIEQFADFSRQEGVIVRFIEFMPLEEDRTWKPETVVPLDEIVARLQAYRPLVELAPNNASETAKRFTFDDGLGEIGIIAPVSRPFCGHCSRVRLTSDGKIRTCLFSQTDHDLEGEMVRGGTDAELAAYIRRVVMRKEARHHIGEPGFEKPSRSMVHIGG